MKLLDPILNCMANICDYNCVHVTIGLPLPPVNLSEELSLNPELLNIMFTWQPPLGLVINNDLTYVASINISVQNLTNEYNVTTSNLSYTHDIVIMEKENYLELCMFGELIVVVHISLSSKNKVGTGTEVHREILLDSLCANAEYTMPHTSDSG